MPHAVPVSDSSSVLFICATFDQATTSFHLTPEGQEQHVPLHPERQAGNVWTALASNACHPLR